MQPIIRDANGVIRFKRNAIVDHFVRNHTIDLSQLAASLDAYSVEDAEQFWQLLGYSVSGYGDLSFVRPETIAEADRRAESLLRPRRSTTACDKCTFSEHADYPVDHPWDMCPRCILDAGHSGDCKPAETALAEALENTMGHGKECTCGSCRDAIPLLARVRGGDR
jgi:hypothetical protein